MVPIHANLLSVRWSSFEFPLSMLPSVLARLRLSLAHDLDEIGTVNSTLESKHRMEHRARCFLFAVVKETWENEFQ